MIKPENQWLLCAKTGGNNPSSNDRLLQSLSNVNSLEMLRGILKKHVQWNVCFKYNGTQLSSSTEIRNTYCNFNHLEQYNCNCSKEKFSEKKFIQKDKYLFLSFGLIAMIGNLVVIFFVSKKLLFVATVQENTVYNILILNLSFANLLLAIYIILLSFIKPNDLNCNALGVIRVTGYQVGTTIITLICYYHLQEFLKLFNVINKKFLLISLLFVWIFWLVFSLLSINSPDVFLPNRVNSIVSNVGNKTDAFSVLLNIVSKFNSSQVHTQLLKSLGIYPNMKFYYQYPTCTIIFFSFKSNGKYLMLAMLLHNSLLFIFVVIAYTTIFFRIFNCRNLKISFFFQSPDNGREGREAKESLKVLKKFFLIVATNFLCWISFCIFGFYFYLQSLNKTNCSYRKFLHYHHTAQKAMLLLTLINPVLNPYIYGDKFWKTLFKNCKTRIFRSQ